ncbi:MAG: hypothetical protein UY76_C0008G0011 [Candidatus Uhrbacteria bacterium GW2011_GWA2_52_8d]|uniref:SHOCT domain-containing protein n=1 Tax=Candidatus Uhrbacteria bacterium GW2011_GWA2_52_8d TaxID=1618979 RepID=A0A0G1XPI7_9BACT|nr:MAG: hypothetical protein UY76_C0008G0011 [Candidatus Uhrbacteria bacterium GW2011_GWA2_52_8d]
MQKILFAALLIAAMEFGAGTVSAQGIMGNVTGTDSTLEQVDDDHTAQEEAEGKIVWEKLQADQVTCADLSNDDFGVLGEYFMGQMMGDSHADMNAMIARMHGEEGEEQIHAVMGKRLSGCDTEAVFPLGGSHWMPMMSMMTGGWSSPLGFNQSNTFMMSFGWIFMVLWWVLIIAGIVALIKWFMTQSPGTGHHKQSSLEILKERYARGEVDKKEFEEMKKNLTK